MYSACKILEKNDQNKLTKIKFTKEPRQHRFSWALSRWRHHLGCWAGNRWTWLPGCRPRTGTQVHIQHEFASHRHFEIRVRPDKVCKMTHHRRPAGAALVNLRTSQTAQRYSRHSDSHKSQCSSFWFTPPDVLRSAGTQQMQADHQNQMNVNGESLPLPKPIPIPNPEGWRREHTQACALNSGLALMLI